MNKYVEIIRDTLWEIIDEASDLDKEVSHCMTAEVAMKIIATIELATKLIRLHPSFSAYADFFSPIAPIMNENEHILKMSESIRDYHISLKADNK